jgi:polyhydroxybutyrate depolymerase
MFRHGWGASGEAMLALRDMVETARARGYAVIAPDGTPREGRNGRGWGFSPERPGPRDEIAFLKAVRDDAIARHGIDANRMILGGFSIGGSMASYLACAEPGAFAAYLPVAGAFWHTLPAGCAGPVDLLHTHGWTDGTVPLEGRMLRGDDLDDEATVAQGDVWQAMQVWRAANGCRPNASGHGETGIFWRRSWHDCDSGKRLDFALFSGGHGVPEGWAAMALDWVEGL